MMKEVCYWSVGDGDFGWMLKYLVHTFRAAGMEDDFLAFSDRDIPGAETVPCGTFNKGLCFFKFEFLKKLSKFPYRYFIYLDADTVFVRKPRDFMELMGDSPLHCFFECDCTYPAIRNHWWGVPLEAYVKLMRECGVTSEKIYNVNGGFIIVKREAIETVCALADDFWDYAVRNKVGFNDEALWAYAAHMLCGDPEKHLLKNNFDVWATDWTGQFKDSLPQGKEWLFKDYMRYDEYLINPAVVHLVKSKDLLVNAGKSLNGAEGMEGVGRAGEVD